MFGWKKRYEDATKELEKTKETLEELRKMYSDLLETYQILDATVNKDKEKRSKAAKKAAEARWHSTATSNE